LDLIFETFDHNSGLEQQRTLFDECFPENMGTSVRTNEHYLWKFHSGPFTPSSFEYVAGTEEKEMLGYYAAIPYPYCIGGIHTSAGMVCDVMTGVKARGKGVFTKLGIYATEELANAGVPFTTGYPIRDEVVPGHLKAGWKIVFPLPLYIKFLKVNNLSFMKKIPLLPSVINSFLSFISFFRRRKRTGCEVKIYEPSALDSLEGLERFIESWQADWPNHLLKTCEFLKWRLGAPGRKYSLVTIRIQGVLKALAITTFTIREGMPSLAILDFMVPGKNRELVNVLHSEVELLAMQSGAEAILAMMSKPCAKDYGMFRNGFLKSPYAFRLIIKKLNDRFSDEQLFAPGNWSLMWIDSDDL
jgi:hypothetical protein